MMRTTFFSLITLFLSALALTGCGSFVQKADYLPVLSAPEDAHPIPIQFSGYKFNLPLGQEVGVSSANWTGCGWPYFPANRHFISNAIESKSLKRAFIDALESQNYDIINTLDLAFDEDEELARAEYKIKAHIEHAQLKMCDRKAMAFLSFFPIQSPGITGELSVDIKWTVYDALRRHVVYKTKTKGYTKRRIPNQEGLSLMFADAFAMAAHNLGASKEFHDLIFFGEKPESPEKNKKNRHNDRPRIFNPDQPVKIDNPPLLNEPFLTNSEEKRKIAVMIQTSAGHGSGFFISKQGHILTNSHIVGKAMRVRIVTAGKEEKLIGEVLRVDRARDVALIRLEEIPDDLTIRTVPIRTDWPRVGEDIYALGAPKSFHKLQDTVTKGIVSAHRKDMKFLGSRQNFIQGDVEIQGGSSGGPLLDSSGNIIGLTVGARTGLSGDAIGLNYFIPINEALAKLDITISDKSRSTDLNTTGTNGVPLSLIPK